MARSEHFEVYSQTGEQRARAILNWYEQLRAFFAAMGGPKAARSATVRVIVFASEQEYGPYRLRSTADAYYVGGESQDSIVMGTGDPSKFGLAAHEYAHLVLRDSEPRLPPWLKEGMAEFFATLRIREHATGLGGVLPGRLQTLRRRTWMPIAELMAISEEAQEHQQRSEADLFYAESWALTEMLALAPGYAPQFHTFVSRIGSGTAGMEALRTIYGKSGEMVARDLQVWLNQRALPVIQLPEIVTPQLAVQVSIVTPPAVRALLAQVLLAAGEFDRAEAMFRSLESDVPEADIAARVSAGLGAIALHRGDSEGARRAWKRAIDQGISDAKLCYQYAILADQAGLPANEIRPALERAIQLQPDFDGARYQLALLEKNGRHFDAALREFRAMGPPLDKRAFTYWLALADTLNELGLRDEAQSAARQANAHATSADGHARAAEQIYIAQTDLSVQFARDSAGRLQLVTARKPHQQMDWNPFIEPSDDIQHIEGVLSKIDCGSVTTIVVEAGRGPLTLTIPDLKHVEMRHAPAEFTCGEQSPAAAVRVDYARTPDAPSAGIVRGMDFP